MEEVPVPGQAPEKTTNNGAIKLKSMGKSKSSDSEEMVPAILQPNNNNNNNNNATSEKPASPVISHPETVQSSAPTAGSDDEDRNPFMDDSSLARIVEKRGSPVSTRKKDVETMELADIATWNTYVDMLFKVICETLNNSEGPFDQYAEHTFLGTVLQEIQKNTYEALKKDPELFAIPPKVFQVIDPFIQAHPILLRKDRMTNVQVENIVDNLVFAASSGITEDFRFPPRTVEKTIEKKESSGCSLQ
ncbi:MAG TPA: hypothetical protein VGV92_05490 [Gammaproteobacteria bacterium]|nr:hypothetical protein [Gammaproteobacteria bacterium]